MPKKKSVTKETSKKQEIKPKAQKQEIKQEAIKKQKMKGGLLMLIGFATLIFVGFFLFGKFFRPQELAELLPAQRAVAVLELNIDGNSGQVKQFQELLKNYPVYQPGGIISLLNIVLPVNYQNELEPWLGRQVGLAIITSTDPSSGAFYPLLFIEQKDHEKALKFFQDRGLASIGEELAHTDYNGYPIYEFTVSQRMSFTFMGSYLVVAESPEILTGMIDDFVQLPRLSDDEVYRKVANNVPQGGLMFGYVNYRKLYDTLEEDDLFITKKGQDLLALRPYLNIFRAEGFSVFAEKDRFVAQSYTNIDNEALNGESYVTFTEPYQGKLLELVDADPIFLAGGHNLTNELRRVEEIFKSGTKTPALVFEGFVESQKKRYLGEKIGLKEDIYPLFTGEYLLTVENSLEKPRVSLLLQLKNGENDMKRFDRIMSEFIEVSGVFSPEVHEVELPDGTIGEEIVASQEKIERGNSSYNGHSITTLKLGDTGIAINYVAIDDLVLMSSDEATLRRMIDRTSQENPDGLTGTPYYERNMRTILRTADEVINVKIGAVTEALGLTEDSMLAPYLLPLKNLTLTKNFFEDGISTTYFIEVL